MRAECFLDTNVLIYAAATRIDDLRKYEIAEDLVATQAFGVSGQVLSEFTANMLGRAAIPLTLAELGRWLDLLSAYPFVPVDADLVRAGIAMSSRYKINYWDGAIIAAAERLGAKTLYTEDLNHGQAYGPVTVINPFRAN